MKALAGLSLLLVVLLVSLSAYLRLAHSGIGCADWPACYGHIGPDTTPAATPADPSAAALAYQRLVRASGDSMAWATPVHRGVASVLGLVIVFLNVLSWKRGRHRLAAAALLGLTVWLAMLGLRSGSLHDPAVVMGNLGGGFAMLALIGWVRFRLGVEAAGVRPVNSTVLASWLGLAVVLLSGQILLGGFTSANFAATACTTVPDCHGGWWPGPALSDALDLGTPHEVSPAGMAVGGPERIAVHRAHRLGAVVAGLVALVAGALALRRPAFRPAALLVLAVTAAEIGVGVASVRLDLPIGLAVAHNWLAGFLLLALIWLLARTLPRPAP